MRSSRASTYAAKNVSGQHFSLDTSVFNRGQEAVQQGTTVSGAWLHWRWCLTSEPSFSAMSIIVDSPTSTNVRIGDDDIDLNIIDADQPTILLPGDCLKFQYYYVLLNELINADHSILSRLRFGQPSEAAAAAEESEDV